MHASLTARTEGRYRAPDLRLATGLTATRCGCERAISELVTRDPPPRFRDAPTLSSCRIRTYGLYTQITQSPWTCQGDSGAASRDGDAAAWGRGKRSD
jgi:hypothetical protein